MKPILRILIIAILAGSTASGCAYLAPKETLTPEQRVTVDLERALLLTSLAVDTTHNMLWSKPLREKLTECTGSADVPACMGPFNPETNSKIVKALEAYHASSAAAGQAVLLGQDQATVGDLISDSVKAALALVALVPGSDRYAGILEGLLRDFS